MVFVSRVLNTRIGVGLGMGKYKGGLGQGR